MTVLAVMTVVAPMIVATALVVMSEVRNVCKTCNDYSGL